MNILPQWWRAHFLEAEFGLAVLITTIFIMWVEFISGHPASEILFADRSEIYNASAAIFGSLLGFIITAVSIVLGYISSDRLTIVRESKQYSTMWRVFTSAIKVLAIATVAALIGLLFDRDGAPVYVIFYFNIFAATLASLRLARCIWVLENIIHIVTQ
jgi:hypothetical protein